MKRQSLSTVKKKLWVIFSRYIRLRDAIKTTGTREYCKCITCKRIEALNKIDAGHFVSGRFSNTLFNEKNVHGQCKHCNGFLAGNQLEYRRQIIKMYGEGADIEIEDLATTLKKFTIPELEDMIKMYEDKINKL